MLILDGLNRPSSQLKSFCIHVLATLPQHCYDGSSYSTLPLNELMSACLKGGTAAEKGNTECYITTWRSKRYVAVVL